MTVRILTCLALLAGCDAPPCDTDTDEETDMDTDLPFNPEPLYVTNDQLVEISGRLPGETNTVYMRFENVGTAPCEGAEHRFSGEAPITVDWPETPGRMDMPPGSSIAIAAKFTVPLREDTRGQIYAAKFILMGCGPDVEIAIHGIP